jgi:hypothetical protein
MTILSHGTVDRGCQYMMSLAGIYQMAPSGCIRKDIRHTGLLFFASMCVVQSLPKMMVVVICPIYTSAIEAADKGIKRIIRESLGCNRQPFCRNGFKRLSNLLCRFGECLVQCIGHNNL